MVPCIGLLDLGQRNPGLGLGFLDLGNLDPPPHRTCGILASTDASPTFGPAERKGGSAGRWRGSRLLGASGMLGNCSDFFDEKLLQDVGCLALKFGCLAQDVGCVAQEVGCLAQEGDCLAPL